MITGITHPGKVLILGNLPVMITGITRPGKVLILGNLPVMITGITHPKDFTWMSYSYYHDR
jgi:hypothetical protein